MIGLITDRTRENVLRREELAAKGRAGMTAEELSEWLGDPFATEGTNLFPPGPYYSSSVELIYRNEYILATAKVDGSYLYAISIIGEASKFEGKTISFSIGSLKASPVGGPKIALYWHDDSGYDSAGISLSMAGGMMGWKLNENTNNRAYLAAYIYVTQGTWVTAGKSVMFGGVMLSFGNAYYPYVPYTEVLATNATKGAYNYSDLNRVERAVAEISDEWGLELVTKTDWTMWDVPRASDWVRYINNVKAIKDAVGSSTALPDIGDRLTYSGANNIETVLFEASKAVETLVRSGEAYCGEL